MKRMPLYNRVEETQSPFVPHAKSEEQAGSALPRVLIQQDCIPHYRIPVFKLLSSCLDMNVEFVTDTHLDIPFLRVVDGSQHGLRLSKAKTHLIRLPGAPLLTWQPDAIRIFIKGRPDALIAQGSINCLTSWVLCSLGRVLGIPVLLWGHGLLRDERGVRWWLRKALYRLASGQLLYGVYARSLLEERGFDPTTLHVVYNSLDYDFQHAIAADIDAEDEMAVRKEMGVLAGMGMVVFTGRLQAVKRLDLLIEAVGFLAGQGKCVHVVLVGDGDERARLVSLAEDLGIAGQIHFLGPIYDERRLGVIISAADLAVVPSGAGLSIMHALSFGTPVLMHDRIEHHFPEWEAVEEGVTGFYYKFEDVGDLSAKIAMALFPHPRKPDMSKYCKTVINERYNPHRQVATIVEAVRSITEL